MKKRLILMSELNMTNSFVISNMMIELHNVYDYIVSFLIKLYAFFITIHKYLYIRKPKDKNRFYILPNKSVLPHFKH